ncbi:MAG TPA: DUF885 family protein [Rhizomicrobium sp.]|jgi:uncharacterized protein (DUF885 family)|nr:DUF885 family protein [Rhizomicrobium sp.]
MNAIVTRRDLLRSSAATAAVLPAFVIPAWAQMPAPAAAPTLNAEAAKLNAMMDAFFQENLHQNPEGATLLGLDKGANASLKSQLRDESMTGVRRAKALNASQLARLKTINPAQLAGIDRVNYDTLVYVGESRAQLAPFTYGGFGFGPSPYVVSQLTGVYQTIPDFLDTKHRIETREDADAYLARLAAFARELDDQTNRMKHDANLGVVPPDFLLDKTLEQLTAIRTTPDKSLLVTSIARRAKEKALPDTYATQAAKIYTQQIAPALDRQIAQARAMRAHATHDAGLWKIRGGEAFYAAALHSATTTDMTADQIHQLGLDQAKEIAARLDTLLRAQGLTQGTVGQRIAALYKDPKQLYPNTDDGKAQCIAYCNQRLAEIKPRLPTVFSHVPPYSFEVRRVPPATEPGAASAFSQPPTLDGSRPGIVYFNLHDTAEWPRLALSTTVFHEGLPGHQLEGGLALANKNLPLIRKAIGFSGYAEGWALYAEQLADEIGMYDNDPYGRIGYLKFQLFRANRCIVDTGIHHLRWSREQAIQYFVDNDGSAPSFATREVERYCATPGQACSYKIGHTVWTKARDRAKTALGAKYNIKNFHDAGLGCGRVPLDILDGVIDRYIATAKAA